MKLEGEYTFAGPPAVLWKLLQDPDVLIKAMPGAKKLERVAEDHYQGVMQIGIGPITAAQFQLTVKLKDKQEPERYGMEIEGKGALGFTRGDARIELAATEDGGTRMRYNSDLQVGGKIAAVGQRLLDTVSRSMTRQGLEALNAELQRRLAADGNE